MTKSAAPALLLLLSAGCATTQPRIQRVEVPVQVACVKGEDIPSRPGGLGPLPADKSTALSRALERLLDWAEYGERADALLRACASRG